MPRYFLSFLVVSLISAYTGYTQINYNEISLPELFQKINQGKKDFVILDVRARGEHHDTMSANKHLNIGHIKGAINIPIQDLQQKPEALKQLDAYKDKEIYVICYSSSRSRAATKLLLEKGFSNTTNIQGGMAEWFRNYDGLSPYREKYYETHVGYKNLAPKELYSKLKSGEKVVYISVSNKPRSFFDSLMVSLYQYFPELKNTNHYKLSDSLSILEKARSANGQTVVIFNSVGSGGSEMADWLHKKGIKNINYLTGNLLGFYEYMVNYQSSSEIPGIFNLKNNIKFYSPYSLCKNIPKKAQFIDLRHDTLFNKITRGSKFNYISLRNAVNFPYYKTAGEFEKQFPDKKPHYIFSPHQGYTGIELADELARKGYNIGFILGGNDRWEWYTNNVSDFKCGEMLVPK